MMVRTVVVLPIPLRPISDTQAPGAIDKDTPKEPVLFHSQTQLREVEASLLLTAKVGKFNRFIGTDFCNCASGYHCAFNHYRQSVSKAEYSIHIMFYKQK